MLFVGEQIGLIRQSEIRNKVRFQKKVSSLSIIILIIIII